MSAALQCDADALSASATCLARIRVEVKGRENVPANTACIFMANHVSNLDPPALIPNIPGRTSAFIKRSLMNIPVSAGDSGWASSFPSTATAAWKARRRASPPRAGCLRRASTSPRLLKARARRWPHAALQERPVLSGQETGAPCIPVSIYGTETMMAKGSLRIRPGTAHITFHPPIDPADFATREELMARCAPPSLPACRNGCGPETLSRYSTMAL